MSSLKKATVRIASLAALVVFSAAPVIGTSDVVHADAAEAATPNVGLAGQLTLGSSFTCAVVSSKVFCWGDNHSGQTGQATGLLNKSPVEVVGTDGAIEVAAGSSHACALIRGGSVKCWGENSSLQLGRTTSSSFSSEVAAVSGITTAIGVAAGRNFSCALLNGGTVKCWGSNAGGQLGTGVFADTTTATPQSVTGLSDGARINAAGERVCVLTTIGGVTCWGRASETAMGAGTTGTGATEFPTPVQVVRNSDLTPISGLKSLSLSNSVFSSSGSACGLGGDGTAWCWGDDSLSQIGSGLHSATAGAFQFKAPSETQPLNDIQQISTGDDYTCMVRANGVPWCIGNNMGGQLGDGTNMYNEVAPVLQQVAEVKKTSVVVASSSHTCSIDTDLVVYCWGTGTAGQIGQGKSENSWTPSVVEGAAQQTITFAELADKALGSGDVTISASSSSGQTVSFSSSTTSVCTVSGTSVKLVAPGTCTITASRAKYGMYAAAADVSRSFAVGGVKPTVTTGSATPQSTKATLNGSVSTGGVDASVSFTYGTDPMLSTGTKTTASVTKKNLASEDVSASISDLTENTKYYFRIDATNSVGKATGEIKSFTTNKPEGVSVNGGDEFTSSQSVIVSVVGTGTATKAILSNDGGFTTTQTFDLVNNAADIPWTLQSSKEGTFTKIVYVRFVSKLGSTLTTLSDDIILDTTKPVISTAGASSTTSTSGAVTVSRVHVSATKAKGVKLTLKGSDTISGIGTIEVRSAASKPSTSVSLKSVAGKTDGKPRPASQTVTLATTAKKLQVRVLDRAGNASAWKSITVK